MTTTTTSAAANWSEDTLRLLAATDSGQMGRMARRELRRRDRVA